MDKNSVLGFVAIGAILVGFSVYQSKQAKQAAAEKRRLDSIAYANVPIEALVPPVAQQEVVAAPAFVPPTTQREVKNYVIENDVIALTISERGGRICEAKLKNYTTYGGDTLKLLGGKVDEFSLQFYTNNSQNFETQNLFFEAQTTSQHLVLQQDTLRFAMRLPIAQNKYVDYVYTLHQGSYMVDFAVNTVGLDNVSQMDLLWITDASRYEKAFANENNYTTLAYRYPNEEGVEDLGVSTAGKQENIKTKLQWIAFKQQFFSSILVAKNEVFEGAQLSYETYGEHHPDALIKHYTARVQVPYQPYRDQGIALAFYLGPNKYSILKSHEQQFEKIVPLGGWIIGWINRFVVIPIFDLLENHIASYGLIILILTLIIKLVLFPLTYKSYLSSAKMRVLKPDVDKITKKYPSKTDAMKKQQETMALYKKTGVSPMGGCLPILIQFPILVAMFRFFPASIELRQQPFLWADDLSAYDSILNLPFSIPFYGDHISLFTLLMAAALYASSRMSMAQTPDTGMPGMKFMTLYMMPVMLLLWFNSYSAGLSYYYCLSNLITIGQNLITRRMVNEEKLHAQLKENSKKPIKKSKFQAKLETMAKQAQLQQKQQKRR
ncbi:membrane protein insertase YidC [Bacteroidia bacterium]|nr:membrane protein insertase YidC [Bacteroidia bacterium]